jgi:hypothetical protein
MGISVCDVVIQTKIMTNECINYINPYQTKTEDIIFYVLLFISFLINSIYICKSKNNNNNKIRKESLENNYQDLFDYNNECIVCLETNKKLKKISCIHILCIDCFIKLKNNKYYQCPMCQNIINNV